MASAKFKALVHQIVDSCEDPHRLGATKLNKICWYTDTIAYRIHGESITGETYVKRKHGPVPKSILATIKELETEQKIGVRDHEYLPSKKVRLFVSLEDPDPHALTEDERSILEYVIDAICNHHTATSISELSHDAIWDAANDGEEIPMQATLVAESAQLTARATVWAKRLVKEVVAIDAAA
jgi:hypothetical protein